LAVIEDPADAAARLEEALERIAALAAKARPGGQREGAGMPTDPTAEQKMSTAASSVDISALAARLDGLIYELRTALGPQPGS
jgi:hypothetical protein